MSFTKKEKSIILRLIFIHKIRNDSIARMFEKIHNKPCNNGRISEVKTAHKKSGENESDYCSKEELDLFLKENYFKINGKLLSLIESNDTKSEDLPDESETIEYKKELCNDKGKVLDQIIKSLAGFANNQGGTIYIGIDNKKRKIGIPKKDCDPVHIDNIIDNFSPKIEFKTETEEISDNKYIFKIIISPCDNNIVISTTQKHELEKCAIYYRRTGKTDVINSNELQEKIEKVINHRIQEKILLVNKITPESIIIKPNSQQALNTKGEIANITIDENIVKRIPFIKEGEFNEKTGTPAIKIIAQAHELTQDPSKSHPYRILYFPKCTK